MDEPFHKRRKVYFHLLLSGGADASQGPTMEGIRKGDDLVAICRCAEFPGQLIETLICLGSAVAEEDLPAESHEFHNQLSQLPLRPRQVEIRGMDERGGLIGQNLR